METSYTLSQFLADRVIPPAEALRRAQEIADALRQIHNQGLAQGVLTPDLVMYTPAGVQLLSAREGTVSTTSPYLAPELAGGRAADACSDIFSFGAILYQMLTGTVPQGEVPPLLDEAQLDRLVTTCLSPERSGRWQRMQQVLVELRLVAASVRRAETGGGPYQKVMGAVHSEIERIERALMARLQEHQKVVSDMLSIAATEASKRHAAAIQAVSETLNAIHSDVSGVDTGFDAVVTQVRGLQEEAKTRSEIIESVHSATVRTDDVVERVVEALETLQGIVFEQSEERQLVMR